MKTKIFSFILTTALILCIFSAGITASALDESTTAVSMCAYIEGNYLYGVQERTTVQTFLDGMEENKSMMFYRSGVKLSGGEYIATGMTAQLVVDNVVTKDLTVSVAGDVNGDGIVTSTDYLYIKSHLRGLNKLVGIYYIAADTDYDSSITQSDYMMVKQYFKNLYDLYKCRIPANNENYGYYYDLLNSEGKQIYSKMLASILSMEDSITFSSEYPSTAVTNAFQSLYYDRGDLFWLANGYSLSTSSIETKLFYKYKFAKDKIAGISAEIDAKASALLATLPDDANDYDKLLLAYEYIINNTVYDIDPTIPFVENPAYTSYGVFIQGKAVCAGYAQALQYLLHAMGVKASTVTGDERESGNAHAWNIVKLDGDDYYVDATWGDPLTQDGTNVISYDYFCITTEKLLETHIIDSTWTMPQCTATKYNYYIYNNMYLGTYTYADFYASTLERISTKPASITYVFDTQDELSNALTDLMSNSKIFTVINSVNSELSLGVKGSIRYEMSTTRLTVFFQYN